MTKISRYILRLHTAPFIMGTATVLFLFFFQFLLKVIDQLLGKGLSGWVILEFFIVNMAWMLVLAVPMGVLFSTLMVFGSMSAAHEVTIVKASGGSLLRMMFPVIVSGTIISCFLFWFNDDVLPEANHRAKVLMNDIKKTRPTFSVEAGQFSTELGGYTILARYVDSASGLLKGLTIYDNSQRDYSNVVSADSGYLSYNEDYTKLVLDLSKGEIHQSMPFIARNYRRINFDKYTIQINAKGFVFEESGPDVVSRGDREMHISDMQKVVDEADIGAAEASVSIDSNLASHLDYLVTGKVKSLGNNKPLPARMRKMNLFEFIASDFFKKAEGPVNIARAEGTAPPHGTGRLPGSPAKKETGGTNDRKAAIQKAQQKLTFIRSAISSDVYRNVDCVSRSRQYGVEIYKKYAIPFACLIFVFVGCPLGIMTKGGNFGLSAAISLGFYILYWACLIMGEKLADRGFLAPGFSMWMGNYIIGVLGIILTLRVNYERFGIAFIVKRLRRKMA